MFKWFKKTNWQSLAEEAIAAAENMARQNQALVGLLSESYYRTEEDKQTSVAYIAAFVAMAGDNVVISKDILDAAFNHKSGIYYEKKPDGSVFFRLITEEEAGSEPEEPCCNKGNCDGSCEALMDK